MGLLDRELALGRGQLHHGRVALAGRHLVEGDLAATEADGTDTADDVRAGGLERTGDGAGPGRRDLEVGMRGEHVLPGREAALRGEEALALGDDLDRWGARDGRVERGTGWRCRAE
ncbi:MAG: hypothetical protein U0869_06140 [Chloroflexota bacterium]